MDRQSIIKGFRAISLCMDENRDYLVELDSRNGDGDLGISMSDGFKAAYDTVAKTEGDFGKMFKSAALSMNEAAPSSLGTICTLILMNMGKYFGHAENAELPELGSALKKGLDAVMSRTGSKPGEKTIIDALVPAAEALENGEGLKSAAEAAARGSERTKDMLPVHGRAAYYGEKGLGLEDGGAVAGKLAFEALAKEF